MKIYAVTQKGPSKAENEDRILVGSTTLSSGELCTEISAGMIAIADGVGGNNAGARASQMVCEALASMDIPTVEALTELNLALLKQSRSDAALKGMATTLSGICFPDGQMPFIFHVGNTRVYSIQAGQYLRQLTEDDTVVQYLVKTGKLTEEEAENYPGRNEITACMGGDQESLFRLKIIPLEQVGGQYLLTSDGIHESLGIDELEDALGDDGSGLESRMVKLIDLARQQGANDDCSAMLLDCGENSGGV